MGFDYEKNIWAGGEVTAKWDDPANVRLRRCLNAFLKLPKGVKILEAGCGAGAFTRALKKARPDLQCYGTDISREAISSAMSKGGGVTYAVSGEYDIPYTDNTFDGIVLVDVLEHITDPLLFLKEINRLLKPGGLLYMFVPCEQDYTSLWNLLDRVGLKKDLTKKFAGHVNYFSRKNLLELAEKTNFSVEKISYAEHLLGQVLGVCVFFVMNHTAKKSGAPMNNEEYFKRANERQGSAMPYLKKMVNWLVTLESEVFAAVPSPNVHILAKKI